MLLTAISALLGAFLGMNSRNRLLAALVAAAIAGAVHFVLLYVSSIALAFSSEPEPMAALFAAVGVRGVSVAYSMGAASAAALVAGLLLTVSETRDRNREYAARGPSPELSRIGDILEADMTEPAALAAN